MRFLLTNMIVFFRHGGGFIPGGQSGQCDCGRDGHLPLREKSRTGDWQIVHAGRKQWLLCNPEVTVPASCILFSFISWKLVFSFQMLEEQQVRFHMNSSVTEIQGDSGKVSIRKQEKLHLSMNCPAFGIDGVVRSLMKTLPEWIKFKLLRVDEMFDVQVKAVVLKSGTVLEADVVVAGIGNYPVQSHAGQSPTEESFSCNWLQIGIMSTGSSSKLLECFLFFC